MCAGGLKCQRTKRACLLCGRRATFEGLQSIMRRTAVSILGWQEDGGCEFHFRLRTKMRSVLSSSPAPVSSSFKLLTASHALHDSYIELLLFFLFFIFFPSGCCVRTCGPSSFVYPDLRALAGCLVCLPHCGSLPFFARLNDGG